MKSLTAFLAMLLTSLLICCSYPYVDKNYKVGETKSVYLGDPIFSITIGDLNPDAAVEKTPIFTTELVYSGVEDSTIICTYREYYRNRLREAYSRDYRYDLSRSKACGYRGLRFIALEANNELLRVSIDRDMGWVRGWEKRADSLAREYRMNN